MEAQRLAYLENGSTDHNNTDVEHAAAASITTTTTGLSSVNKSSSAPYLSDGKLVILKLKDQNDTSDFVTTLTLPKEKVNNNNFEECITSSRPIASIPSRSIKQMFCDKGAPEGTAAHQVLETSSKFNYRNFLGELMYVYITCRPNIGYTITTLSKFSSEPSVFHYTA